jgi:hypothetical protein
MFKSANWSESDGFLMFRGRIHISKDRYLRYWIMEQHHNTSITGHTDCFKTLKIVSWSYWWLHMSRYISDYIKTCNLCNWIELQHWQTSRELHASETPEEQWDVVSIDLLLSYWTSMAVMWSWTSLIVWASKYNVAIRLSKIPLLSNHSKTT